jgi:IQ domain-containing protein H
LDQTTERDEISRERTFFYTPFLIHPGLVKIHYNTFFHMCRIENIFFDIDKKTGSTFLMLDSLQTGVLSLMGIGKDYNDML